MIKIHCDRYKREIEVYPYFTIQIRANNNPRTFLETSTTTASYNINKTLSEILNEQPVYCANCINEIEAFIKGENNEE